MAFDWTSIALGLAGAAVPLLAVCWQLQRRLTARTTGWELLEERLATAQLAQTALRSHYALTGRLLEQAPGEVFDVGAMPQAWAVKQPQGDFQGKTLGCGNSLGGVGNRR